MNYNVFYIIERHLFNERKSEEKDVVFLNRENFKIP